MNRERHTINKIVGRPQGVPRALGRIARTSGSEIIRSGTFEKTPASENDLLYEGDQIKTRGSGEAVLKPRGGRRMYAPPGSLTQMVKGRKVP